MTAFAEDRTAIPITVVHKQGIKLNRSNPCVVMTYGSYVVGLFRRRGLYVWLVDWLICRYGVDLDTSFDAPLMSLIRRGWVVAYTHTRCVPSLKRPHVVVLASLCLLNCGWVLSPHQWRWGERGCMACGWSRREQIEHVQRLRGLLQASC